MKRESLELHIEIARQRLNDMEKQYGIEHISILEQSKLLDELINEYNRTYFPKQKNSISR